MKLGFITACLPKRTLTQVCEWAEAEGPRFRPRSSSRRPR